MQHCYPTQRSILQIFINRKYTSITNLIFSVAEALFKINVNHLPYHYVNDISMVKYIITCNESLGSYKVWYPVYRNAQGTATLIAGRHFNRAQSQPLWETFRLQLIHEGYPPDHHCL